MEASRKGKEFMMPFWIISFIAFCKLCVTTVLLCSLYQLSCHDMKCSSNCWRINNLSKKQKAGLLWWSTSVFRKAEISWRVLPRAPQEPPWFMAIVQNLMVVVMQSKAWCRCRCSCHRSLTLCCMCGTHARKVQKEVSKFVLGLRVQKAQHISQLLSDEAVGEDSDGQHALQYSLTLSAFTPFES